MSRPRLEDGILIATGTECILKRSIRIDIPTLLWPDGIDRHASDWFRYLVLYRDLSPASVHEYANILRPFLRHCRKRRRDWRTVDDDFLIEWRDHLISNKRLSTDRVNESIQRIFSYFCWAERSRIVRYHVGIYTEEDLGPERRNLSFAITAEPVFAKSAHGVGHISWRSTIKARQGERRSAVRHTPTEEEIRELHEIALSGVQGDRDSLIFSWAEETGARRAEILQVCLSQLPNEDQLSGLIDRDEPWIISIKRKGGSIKPLPVLPELIIRTFDYIANERTAVVASFSGTLGYSEPDQVFLSTTTGQPLHPDSVTKIGRRAFDKAGIKCANIHRLRARFAVRTIETLVDAVFDDKMIGAESNWIETILVKAAEMMGHGHPSSLRPYLTYVLNRRIQTSAAMKGERLRARLRQLQLQEATICRRLDQERELGEAARDLRAGDPQRAAERLRRLADELMPS